MQTTPKFLTVFIKNVFAVFLTIAFVSGTLIYLNFSVFRDYRFLFEPVVYLWFCLFLLLLIVRYRPVQSLTPFELVFLAFTLYRLARAGCTASFHIGILADILFPVLLYYGLRLFAASCGEEASSRSLLLPTLILLAIYPPCILSGTGALSQVMTYLFTPNASAFSILLAAQLAFVIPFVFYYCKRKGTALPFINWIILVLIAVSVFILVLTKGRSGWIGFLVASAVAGYICLPASRVRKIIISCAVIALFLTIPFLIWYKWDSSAGRMLIYKVSFTMLRDNWLFGISEGQFRVQYSEYQSSYFSSRNIDSKEALLADNTLYAFNEPLQLLIENGLFGFILFLAAILCLFISAKRLQHPENKFTFISAIACLSCIAAASLSFYPFHILPVLLYAIFCLTLINSNLVGKWQVTVSGPAGRLLKMLFILVASALTIHYLCMLQYRIKSDQATKLSEAGFKNKAIETYSLLSKSYLNEGETMLAYGKELSHTNKLIAASEVFNKCKKHYCTLELYSLSAATFHELKQYNEAVKDYRIALYMVPNRMRSRYDLMEHYLSVKDTANAVFWAKSILNMTVKIPSKTTRTLQERTAILLDSISH